MTLTATLIQAPQEIPETDNRLRIFLAGSIDMGNADNWQVRIEQELGDHDIILFNPRRDDWNESWKAVKTDPVFRQQVLWEMQAMESADIIIMNFEAFSQSPITLLELGLHARTGKLMVVCPKGFWRKGNVDMVCDHYNINMYNTIEELLISIKEKIYIGRIMEVP